MPVADPAPPDQESEVLRLRQRVAELEAAEATRATQPSPRDPEAPKQETPLKLADRLTALAPKGLNAFADPDFRALMADIKKAGSKAIAELAAILLKSESAQERFLAAALLEGAGDPAAIPSLGEALQKDADDLVRRMASHALAMIGTEPALPALRSAMAGDADWGVRVNSSYGLAKQGQADGLKVLEEYSTSSKTPPEYKLAVLAGLGDVAAPSSAPIFRRFLTSTTDMTYLIISISALEKMKDAGSIPDLQRVAANAALPANVREAAKKAAEVISK
jgi:HEAT repeat protein